MKTLSVRTVGGYEETVVVIDEIAYLAPETSDVTIIVLKGGGSVRAEENVRSLREKLEAALV